MDRGKAGVNQPVFQKKERKVGISTPWTRVTQLFPTTLSPRCGVPAKARKKDIILNLSVFGLLFYPICQLGYLVVDRASLGHQLSDLPVSVHNRGVVAPPEGLANLR